MSIAQAQRLSKRTGHTTGALELYITIPEVRNLTQANNSLESS